ncbi:DnaJ-domain-containing protein [Saitoella complicata NRRL Y-17804]|nr:DnaJ-domain-containing protein [Saitoella complicata NRRL Y-17804]ODQ52888.1 DnaJ-domain-containing protein [Saitoella complicata NRRL Y-17804]
MEANKEDALKALAVARRKWEAGDAAGALKFVNKSLAMCSTPEGQAFLKTVQTGSPPSPSEGTSSSSTSSAQPSAGTTSSRPRPSANHSHGPEQREFTSEQEAAVRRVRRCKATAYYEILDIKKEATDGEVKKAYRKLALQMHPDKNGAPGADEAFKMISKAFQVLSDSDKRTMYDRVGGDPESRMPAGGGGGGFNGFGGRPGAANMFGEEIDPNDIFNMFFGQGGFGGGGFGGGFGPGVAFGGGPGIRMHQFGGNGFGGGFGGPRVRTQGARRAGREQQEQKSLVQQLIQLLPLIVLFIIPLLSSLFGDSTAASTPTWGFQKQPPMTEMRTTPKYNINYFVDPKKVDGWSRSKFSKLGNEVEVTYVRGLQDACSREHEVKTREMNDAYGFWGIRPDTEKYEAAKSKPMPACERLQEMGYRISNQYY